MTLRHARPAFSVLVSLRRLVIQFQRYQQLLTGAKEKAVVRWIYQLEEWGFPLRIQHLIEAVTLL